MPRSSIRNPQSAIRNGRARLLVSVRDAAEAEAALAGGADLIDVKDPARGPLGRASDAALAEVVCVVAGRRPVSAALGELLSFDGELPAVAGSLAYLKAGPAGLSAAGPGRWAERLAALGPPARVVAVAYADWGRAGAPSPDEVCAFALHPRAGAFILPSLV